MTEGLSLPSFVLLRVTQLLSSETPSPWTPSSPLFPMGMLFFPVTLQVLLPPQVLLLLPDVSHPNYFLHYNYKMPDITHLKEEGFILADRIRDFIPGWLSVPLDSTVHWHVCVWSLLSTLCGLEKTGADGEMQGGPRDPLSLDRSHLSIMPAQEDFIKG